MPFLNCKALLTLPFLSQEQSIQGHGCVWGSLGADFMLAVVITQNHK